MTRHILFVLAISLVPAAAFAQPNPPNQNAPDRDRDGADEDVDRSGKSAAPTPQDALPKPESDDDVAPQVAQPEMPPGGIVEQAGTGGPTGYGRAGVLELGGSAGFRAGSGFSQVSVAPSIGWFVADNLQLSTILDVTHVSMNDEGSTVVTGLVEPSYHLPFNRTVFGFLGFGLGASYVSELGGGFAMAPRLGANVTVGRSGILTPSVSWQYTTTDIMTEEQSDTAVVAVSSAVRVNVGYTVMW